MKIGQDKLEQLCTEGVITSEQLECIVQRGQDAKHSFLQLMLILSLSLLSLGCFVLGMGLLLGQYWERLGQIGALAASLLLAWAGFFLLQKRQPVIAQGFALAGGGLWWACLLFIDARYSLDWKISEFILLIFAGLALIPFVSRQILMIGVVAALSFMLVTDSFDDNYIPFYGAVQMGKELAFLVPILVVLLWWLLAEHWRESNSRFRSYAWIGVPAFLVFLAKAQYPLRQPRKRRFFLVPVQHRRRSRRSPFVYLSSSLLLTAKNVATSRRKHGVDARNLVPWLRSRCSDPSIFSLRQFHVMVLNLVGAQPCHDMFPLHQRRRVRNVCRCADVLWGRRRTSLVGKLRSIHGNSNHDWTDEQYSGLTDAIRRSHAAHRSRTFAGGRTCRERSPNLGESCRQNQQEQSVPQQRDVQ